MARPASAILSRVEGRRHPVSTARRLAERSREVIDPQAPDFSDTPAAASRPVYGYTPRHPRAEPPQVSVVTTARAAGELLAETARSVRGQSFQRWEWLIVGDASTGSTLEPYRTLDPRIRIVA